VQAREELETTLHELSADLRDLVESVRAIEVDPYRFGIELDEVQRRRGLVDDVGREIEAMRDELKRTVEERPPGQVAAGRAGGVGAALPSPSHFDNLLDGEQDGDYYAEMEHQRQQEMMEEQDQQLDGVFRTVGNLRQQADDMGRELEEQAEILNDVDSLADRVGGKLQSGVRRVGHIIRKNEGLSFVVPAYDVKTPIVLTVFYCDRHHVKLLHRSFDYGTNSPGGPANCAIVYKRGIGWDGILGFEASIQVLTFLRGLSSSSPSSSSPSSLMSVSKSERSKSSTSYDPTTRASEGMVLVTREWGKQAYHNI
jgi:hypothetical protein